MQFLLTVILALLLGIAPARADSLIHNIPTNTTNPIPAGSCFVVDQGPGTDTKLCSNYAATIGAMSLTGSNAVSANNTWTGINATTPVALTNGATVTPTFAGSVDLTLTLTQNSFIACPSAGQTVGQKPTFYFTQGTGSGANGFQPTWDICYGFPNFAPPSLTIGTDGAQDMIGCSVLASSGRGSIWCGSVQQTIGYGVLVRNNHTFSSTCTSATSCTLTVSNVVAGDLAIFGVYTSGSSNNPTSTDVTSISDAHGNNCARATNTFKANTNGRATEIWYCAITTAVASGDVWTANYGVTESFTEIMFVPIAGGAGTNPDLGLGNGAAATSAAPSVTATGATTQPYQFVYGMFKADGCGTYAATGGATLLDVSAQGSNPNAHQYLIPASSGSTPTMSGTCSSSTPWAISIAVFGHR